MKNKKRLSDLLALLQHENPADADSEHMSDELVFGYFAGSLNDSQRSSVAIHISQCDDCARHVSELQRHFDHWENEMRLELSNYVPPAVPISKCPKRVSGGKSKTFDSCLDSKTREKVEHPMRGSSDYFLQQMRIDVKEKRRLARWVLAQHPLRAHAGVVIDAGSSTFHVWKMIRRGLVGGNYRNLTVMTNNCEVLSDWMETQRTHPILGTTVDVAGGIFDASHRAFYGSQERKKISSMLFSYVYIGIAGLEMDDSGRFLIGYHSEPYEVQSKHVLFQPPCEARILLVTARKIGYAGSRALNLFDIPNANWKAPICLVSTTPTTREQGNAFERLKRSLLEGRVRDNLLGRQMTFKWSIVDCSTEHPELVDDIVV